MTHPDDGLASGRARDSGAHGGDHTVPEREVVTERSTIPPPAEEQVIYRANPDDDVRGAERSRFDIPATIAGALAALGALLLLSSILGAVVGTIGYQTGVDGQDLSIGGLIAGLVVLFIAALVGGWVAGRMARRRGALHGLVAMLWLVLLAVLLAVLAAVAGDKYDVRDRVGLPNWFSGDAVGPAAIITGLLAVALLLLGGWLGGRWGDRGRTEAPVEVVETRRAVRQRRGGIIGRDQT